MTGAPTRRGFFFHGFILLLLAFLAGIPVAISPPYDAKLWLAAHISGMFAGLFLIAIAAVWNELRLSAALQRVTQVCALIANYTAFLLLGAFDALVGAPLKVIVPRASPLSTPIPAGITSILQIAGGVVAVTTLVWVALVIYGLRGAAKEE